MTASENPLPEKGRRWFQLELVAAQPVLFAYARTLMGGSPDAWDVLQSANLVMCEKEAQIGSAADFLPWAYTVVRYEVMAYRTRASRDRHVFSLSVLERLAEQAVLDRSASDRMVAELERCLEKLPQLQQACAALRYEEGLSLGELARRTDRSENAVAAVLYRARMNLAHCMEAAMAKEDEP